MKKILSLLSLASLTVGLLGSCSKINERIDGLDKRVYDLENNKIASVEQQITAINTSINELKAADVTINGKIADLKTAADAQQALIDALQEADRALGQKDAALEARIATLESQVNTINGQIETLVNADIAINTRIDQLQSYVDTEIGKAKDWATASFASLTQYQKTAEDLAALSVTVSGISTTLAEVQTSIDGLDAKIDGIDAALQEKITTAKTELEGKISDLKTELEGKIAEAISTSEASLKGWVNEKLTAYYTAAQMDAKIDELQSELQTAIDALEGDIETNKSEIEELETTLAQLEEALEAAKATIKSEYEAAIATAIEEYNGTITQTIQTKIDAVNATITALTGRVETLESDVATLKNDVAALKAMIQSVSITPAYSDGSVEADESGILTIKCIISPAEALIGMESLKDNLLIYADYVKVKTKSSPAYTEITVSEATVLDAAQGAITLKADISEYLPEGTDKALTVALKIKNGISNYTTEFVPVYVARPVLPAGALSGVFSVSATKKVYFSKGNLWADSNKALHFEANQYSSASSWDASHVSHFTWSSTVEAAVGNSNSGDNIFCNESHKVSVDGGEAIYYALSKDEWTYLFISRTMTNNKARYSNAVNGVTIGGSTYKGVFLYPDNYNGDVVSSSMTWDAINAAGIVFLPAAGGRDGSSVGSVGDYGLYWSSSAYVGNFAYRVYFNSDGVSPDPYGGRNVGFSVRLITECQ